MKSEKKECTCFIGGQTVWNWSYYKGNSNKGIIGKGFRFNSYLILGKLNVWNEWMNEWM